MGNGEDPKGFSEPDPQCRPDVPQCVPASQADSAPYPRHLLCLKEEQWVTHQIRSSSYILSPRFYTVEGRLFTF